ncbi:DUF2092 domain-containing protein [Stieleria sp. JC731]|uniref:DUF2092 domain-containing protein n=1 Tax=Pirellulaceae TaxID=2691357 RepID=UPI001E5520F0|nr:DUF2092 domain-containing protein [Stieleria sp. JC731]MCC9599254.1 DUF2092 domain-containing protein [Stieleria sp. JC731]
MISNLDYRIRFAFRIVLFVPATLFAFAAPVCTAQEKESPKTAAADSESSGDGEKSAPADPDDQPQEEPNIDAETVKAIEPLFSRIRDAKSTRVSIDVAEETIIGGAIISSKTSSYQIASTAPQQFTVYFKSDQQRTRIYNSDTKATIAITPSAFCHLPEPLAMQSGVFELPFPMGPYPEPVLALSLAGVDPQLSLLSGVKSVEVVDRDPFRGDTPAIHFFGIQDDDVKWQLWVSQAPKPMPLRLLVDLTDMLRANGSVELPEDYQFVLRFDFKSWSTDLDNSEKLYSYTPIKDAKEFASLQEYFDAAKP